MDSGQWAVDTETMGGDNYQSVGTRAHWTLGHAATAHWTSCHHAGYSGAATGQNAMAKSLQTDLLQMRNISNSNSYSNSTSSFM